jgi:acyl-CoA hydrolase
VPVGKRDAFVTEVTSIGRTSIETRIEVSAEPFDRAERRRVAMDYALSVALNESGHRPRPVPPLGIQTDAQRRQLEAARGCQDARLTRRADAQAGDSEDP